MVKEKFLTIYNDAKIKAEAFFNKEILPKISSLPIQNKITLLESKRTELKQEGANISVTPYLKNSNSEEWLLKLFASRAVLLEVDDTNDLRVAVYLGTLLEKINDMLFDLKSQIPEYTFDDFINGREHQIFKELDYLQYYATREDYLNIKYWQTDQLIKVVSFETSNLISGLQNLLKQNPQRKDVLRKDVEIYDNHIAKYKNQTADELAKHLGSITFMSNYHWDKLNNAQLVSDHQLFTNSDLPWSRITPQFITETRARYSQTKSFPFSDTPFIFYSLHQTIKWVKTILDGAAIGDNFTFPDYTESFENTSKDAHVDAESYIAQFNEQIKLNSLSKKEAEKAHIMELESIRHRFNASDEIVKEYFASIRSGERAQEFFKLNAFFFDLSQHTAFLKEAYMLDELMIHFIMACRELSGKNRVNYPGIDDGSAVAEILYLTHNMVLDSDLHEKISGIFDEFMLHTNAYSVPFDIALQNVREAMHALFLECVDRLLNYLEDADPLKKVMFIQSRLKQLKQREIRFTQFADDDIQAFKPKYTSLLREYLEIEAEFIKETKDISFFSQPLKLKNTSVSSKEQHLIEKTFSFGCKTSKESLRKLILELNNQIYLLRDSQSGVENLVRVLTSDNLSMETEHIHFNCETTQLYYVFNKLSHFFTNLSFQNIEKSQLFFTKKGNPLKAQNLSSSKVDYPKDYKQIDKAFSHLL
jgi:hypothetical protein